MNLALRDAKVRFSEDSGRAEALLDLERLKNEVYGGALTHAVCSFTSSACLTRSVAIGVFLPESPYAGQSC